jgi:transcriptional regulator with XRE-family HTH domain
MPEDDGIAPRSGRRLHIMNGLAYSPHEIFARNLLDLSTRRGSIADACRGLGMNRQQFSKYLAGTTLPSRESLARICAYFEVGPESLFLPAAVAPGSTTGPAPGLTDNLVSRAIAAAAGSMTGTELRAGCYNLFFPWPGNPDMCVKAGLAVYRRDGFTLFSRLAKYQVSGRRNTRRARRRDDGIVLRSNGSLHMLAHERKGFRDISLLSFGRANALGPGTMNGLALGSITVPDPVAMRVSLEYRGSLAAMREAIETSGLIPASSPEVPEEFRAAMRQSSAGATPYLTTFNPAAGDV